MAKKRRAPADVMRAARAKQKKTQAQIADELGITQAAVARWENGHTHPEVTKLEAVARVYGVRPELLIPFEERA